MKDSFYFQHDYAARTDFKIRKLIQKHGMEGYGIFWAIIEDLYNNANAMPTDYECIAHEMRCNADVVRSIINDFNLFFVDVEGQNIFTSPSIKRRLEERNNKSEKAHLSAISRWNANAMRTQCDSNAIKERKGKENKLNKINNIKNTYADNVNLSPDEYEKLIQKFGQEATTKMIDMLDLYKGSKGATYKSDYKAILSWVVDKYNEKVNSKPKTEGLNVRKPLFT